MGQLTLPPEMLPCTGSCDAEVVVCVGPPKCTGEDGPCLWCITVSEPVPSVGVTDH